MARVAPDTSYKRLDAANANDEVRRVSFLERVFHIEERGSNVSTEVRAGVIAWMTMSYIMVVNPVILGRSEISPDDPLRHDAVMTATALSAAVGSFLVGVLGNAPLGLMPGMGLNAYFAFGICHAFKVSWEEALSCCFASGFLLVILAYCGLCQLLIRLVLSEHLKKAITVAIGLFQALIGFQVMGLVISSSDTLVQLGNIGGNLELYLSLFGLCAISLMLVRQIYGALLWGIWGMALCAWISGLHAPPSGVFGLPRFDAAFVVDFTAWLPGSGKLVQMLIGTLVLLFVALFDLAGVQYGLMGMARLLEDGAVPRSNALFASSGLSTMFGALLGTSPVIIANESSAGIMEGAKTGLCSCVISVLFLLSAFITPLLESVPQIATAVPLVLIGAFMMSPASGIDWDQLRVAIPSFLTITVVPFTYSIHNGIIAGICMDLFLDCLSATQPELQSPLRSPPMHSPMSPRPIAVPYMHVDSKLGEQAGRAWRLLNDLEIDLACNQDQLADEVDLRKEALKRALEAFLEGHNSV